MARELARRSLPSGRVARIVMSEAADGDIASGDAPVSGPGHLASAGRCPPSGLLGEAPRPWTTLHQVHGAAVAVVDEPGGASGTPADAAVTDRLGAALSVRVADCVPVAFVGHSTVALAHAGWRGLMAGVLEASVDALSSLDVSPNLVGGQEAQGPGVLSAVVGPHIRPCCYEFGVVDLSRLVDAFGAEVAARTRDGRPALNLAAVVSAVLARRGVIATFDGACTSCDDSYWSFRATGTACRQAMLAWMEPAPESAR